MNNDTEVARVNFRPLTLADLSQVEAIENASFPTPWPKSAFVEELKRKRRSVCWVAEKGRVGDRPILVGSIVIWISGDLAHIGTLAVRPGFRKQGIGQQLLGKTLLVCYKRGVKKAVLEVRASNIPAQKLYSKFGFIVAGHKPDYYQDTHEDAFLLQLTSLDPVKLAELADPG